MTHTIADILAYLDTDPTGAVIARDQGEIHLPEISTWIMCNGSAVFTIVGDGLHATYPWIAQRLKIRRHVRAWLARQEDATHD